jgi:hypothetical protein
MLLTSSMEQPKSEKEAKAHIETIRAERGLGQSAAQMRTTRDLEAALRMFV